MKKPLLPFLIAIAIVAAGGTLTAVLLLNLPSSASRTAAQTVSSYKIDTVIDNYAAGGYGRWDVMVGGGMGFDLINRIRLSVGYDFGMLNRNTNSTAIARHRNQLNAGVALLF